MIPQYVLQQQLKNTKRKNKKYNNILKKDVLC